MTGGNGMAARLRCWRALAVASVVGLLPLTPARAAPMSCSVEYKACVTACGTIGQAPSSCFNRCHAQQAACLRRGCWFDDNGRYCGLLRQ
jgi:hypothetical protein